MKQFLLLFFAATQLVACCAKEPSRGDVMKYRIIPVSSGQWIDPKARDAVREQVDRIAADGYNVITVGTFYFMPAYFIDYSGTPYPEAVQYPAAKVRSNLETFRDHIRYAKSKGIQYVVSRSYSHYAPYNFWAARQAELNPDGVFDTLLRKAHQNDMFSKALAGRSPNTVPQQQWTNPVFRDFFLWSTGRVLDLVPELDGFLNAYAEAAWTYDLEKLRENKWKSWKEAVDYEKTDSCFVDYTNRLWQMLCAKRGTDCFFGLRDWYVSTEVMAQIDVPKDKLVIAVKYAGYDQPLVNYPPWAKDLLDKGYSVVLDMHVYDAEYPSPVYWYNCDIINKIMKNVYTGEFSGIVNQDYTLRGEDKADNPIRVLTQQTVAAAMRKTPWEETDILAFLEPYYGVASTDVLRSLRAVAEAQEIYVKLMPAWFWRGDGLSVGGVQPQQFWMLADNPEVGARMDFVRQDVVGMPEYIEAFLSGEEAFIEAIRRWQSEGRMTPPEVIETMNVCAAQALKSIKSAHAIAPDAPIIKDLVASAYIHKYLVQRNSATIRAAIDFYKSGYIYNGRFEPSREKARESHVDLGDDCVAELQQFIAADLVMRRIMLDYAPRRRVLRHTPTYSNEKKIAEILDRKLVIPALDEEEWERVRMSIEGKKQS